MWYAEKREITIEIKIEGAYFEAETDCEVLVNDWGEILDDGTGYRIETIEEKRDIRCVKRDGYSDEDIDRLTKKVEQGEGEICDMYEVIRRKPHKDRH